MKRLDVGILVEAPLSTLTRVQDIIPATNHFLRNFLDLLRKMFVYDPALRITAKQALLHPWFRDSVRDDGTEAARIALERTRTPRYSTRGQAMSAT